MISLIYVESKKVNLKSQVCGRYFAVLALLQVEVGGRQEFV